MAEYRPDPKILELGPDFYDAVEPARFPKCIPRFVNQRWAERIGLGKVDWAAHFCRFEPLPDNLTQPLALRYHGHQFRVYNPDIGDGRGFLFAQLRGPDARLLDLGTKGSGQTPYSRNADGRLTLKGGVREVLATEMLQALGVNTSKTFALFETGEDLERGDDAVHLFDLVSQSTATLAASYLAAGFVHGVLNSDNINITGESFDYGPWRFTPDWDPAFTAAYFDHYGLYSFARQPEAIHWDLAQFAGSLTLIADPQPLTELLGAWGDRFEAALTDAMLWRLGVASAGGEADRALVAALVAALQTREATIDRVFFDWRGGGDPGAQSYPSEPFRALARALRGRERPQSHPYWSDGTPCAMHIDEVEAIWSAIAEADDWQPLDDKVTAVRRMGEAMMADAPTA